MHFLWDFLQNMLENGDSNLQTKFGVRVHITSNIFKIIKFKNHGIAPTPLTSQLWKLTLPPEWVVGSKFFALKRKKKLRKSTVKGRHIYVHHVNVGTPGLWTRLINYISTKFMFAFTLNWQLINMIDFFFVHICLHTRPTDRYTKFCEKVP